ncbi:MAG: cellulase family glycosylhydrolase [Candidatus Omnitrophica bacterium]|nr:cellulase family glycosylhydrolase [Candidatus Omnitrophota bacterium]
MKKYIIFSLSLITLYGCISKISYEKKEIINIFDRKDAIFSPSGKTNPEEIAFSPNMEFYAKEIEPYNSGKIGIFLKTGEIFNIIKTLPENQKNDLKGIFWHPNNSVIGVLYHRNKTSIILFYEIYSLQLLRKILIEGYYHFVVFDNNGRKIYISKDGEKIEEINLRNTDFVYNSGINLPWINYGWDVGRNPWEKEKHGGFSSNKNILFDKFMFFKNSGMEVIRVFLFCDFRSGVIFDKFGNCFFDEYVYNDFKTLVETAKETNIKILPVLFDYTICDGVSSENGVPVGEHKEIFYDFKIQKKLLKLFETFFEKIESKNVIYGWDIINEPEHMNVNQEKLEIFINSFIKIIKKHRKNEPVTVGSFSQNSLKNYKKFNFDFYQFHYYDSFQNHSSIDIHFYNLFVDRPVIIGELEPTAIVDKLTKIWEKGYKGVLIWPNEEFLNKDWRLYKAWVDVH